MSKMLEQDWAAFLSVDVDANAVSPAPCGSLKLVLWSPQ